MLTFLSSYAEQREDNEREKMELMKEAKEERKSFFNQLLQIMSKRKWHVPSQESIVNVFKVNRVSYGTDFIEDWIDALKVWNH